jgi:hypothetical protein
MSIEYSLHRSLFAGFNRHPRTGCKGDYWTSEGSSLEEPSKQRAFAGNVAVLVVFSGSCIFFYLLALQPFIHEQKYIEFNNIHIDEGK